MNTADLLDIVKGLGIGTAVAVPVGPMSLLCMRRTLAQGWSYGVCTGAGIACGDALFALVAALGLVEVLHFMAAHERPLHLVAGSFLFYLGWRTFFRSTVAPATGRSTTTAAAAFGSALVLTLTNPPTIVSFFALMGALLPKDFNASAAIATAAGVFVGSLLWWIALTALVAAARQALGIRARSWIDRCSGALLGIFGATELRRAL